MTDYEQDTWAINCPEKITILKSDAEQILKLVNLGYYGGVTGEEWEWAKKVLQIDP